MYKAVFFDRDGVINIDYSYVYKVEDFVFYDDFFASVDRFKKSGYKIVVITNQSGIERGFYSIKDFLFISKYMQDTIYKKLGFVLDRIYFCPLLNDAIRRKPAFGMITQAQQDLNLDLTQSLLVGDKQSDVLAGKGANIPHLYLINRLDSNQEFEDISLNFDIHKITSLRDFKPL